jgi:isopenicillin N synthase-like dioxygenase
MLDTPAAQVPALSLADEARDPAAFAAAFGGSFERFGFAIVADHGIPLPLIQRAWSLTEEFFALPEDEKRGYYDKAWGGQRGYTPFKTEIAKDAKHVDLKEFWHVGRDLPEGHPAAATMMPNVWPSRPGDFQEALTDLWNAFDRAGLRLLSAIARHLKLSPDYFETVVDHGNSILRLLHYPPIPADAEGVRAGAHEDINLITLLLGAEEAGLELLDRDGKWLAIRPPEGAMVVNVGDMLQRLTNKVLRSTTHRVMNPAPERRGVARYSMPFFLHFRPDYLIETLPQCVSDDRPDLFPEPITAHDYLLQRLREIKLI